MHIWMILWFIFLAIEGESKVHFSSLIDYKKKELTLCMILTRFSLTKSSKSRVFGKHIHSWLSSVVRILNWIHWCIHIWLRFATNQVDIKRRVTFWRKIKPRELELLHDQMCNEVMHGPFISILWKKLCVYFTHTNSLVMHTTLHWMKRRSCMKCDTM